MVAKKAKPGRPLTSVEGPQHQDHAKMNARILGNVMAVQRQNDQKVASRTRAKAQREWNHMVANAKQCPPFPKTSFGQISLRVIVEGVGPQCLGRGQCASRCNITDREG